MAMEIKGTVHMINATKQVSEKFSKREFVVTIADNPKYPQMVMFEATGDRIAQLDSIQVGDSVTVQFNIRGREWRSPSGEVKYFTTLDAWRVEAQGGKARGGSHDPAASRGATSGGGDDDQIPF